jgi:hypothetical protein
LFDISFFLSVSVNKNKEFTASNTKKNTEHIIWSLSEISGLSWKKPIGVFTSLASRHGNIIIIKPKKPVIVDTKLSMTSGPL